MTIREAASDLTYRAKRWVLMAIAMVCVLVLIALLVPPWEWFEEGT